MGWRDKVVAAAEAPAPEKPRSWRDKIVQPEEPGAIERIQAAADDKPLWEYALGPFQPVVGPARVLADTVTQGADSPLAREAVGMARGAAEGVGSYWRDMVADFTSGDAGRFLGRTADLAQKTLLPSGAPLVEAIVKPETGANAARMAKELGVGMASTIAKGRLDEDRPLSSAMDLVALGGAASRFAPEAGAEPGSGYRHPTGIERPRAGAPTATDSQARALDQPRGLEKALRTKAKHLRAQDDYIRAQKPHYANKTRKNALEVEKKALDARASGYKRATAKADEISLKARDSHPLTKKARDASADARARGREIAAHQERYLAAKKAGADDAVLNKLLERLEAAKDEFKLAQAKAQRISAERYDAVPEMARMGRKKAALRAGRKKHLDPKIADNKEQLAIAGENLARTQVPVSRAVEAVRRLEPQMNESLLTRLVKKTAEQVNTIPTAVKGTPGVLLGEAEVAQGAANLLSGVRRSSPAMRGAVGALGEAGADDVLMGPAADLASAVQRAAGASNYARTALGGARTAAEVLGRHRELMRTDPKYREAMQRAGALNVAEFAAR